MIQGTIKQGQAFIYPLYYNMEEDRVEFDVWKCDEDTLGWQIKILMPVVLFVPAQFLTNPERLSVTVFLEGDYFPPK
jgi:hypothetical protein